MNPTRRATLEADPPRKAAEHLLHFWREELEGLAPDVLTQRADRNGLLEEATLFGAFDQNEAVFLLLKDVTVAYVEILAENIPYIYSPTGAGNARR